MVNVNKYPYFWVKSYLVWRLKIVNATRADTAVVSDIEDIAPAVYPNEKF
jgi:hypothetical protein